MEADMVPDVDVETVIKNSGVERVISGNSADGDGQPEEAQEDEEAEIKGEGATFDLARALQRVSQAAPDVTDPESDVDIDIDNLATSGDETAPRKLSKAEKER